MRELMRTVRFRPYKKGAGPTFNLKLYDLGGGLSYQTWRVGYELIEHQPGQKPRIIFEGDDFRPGASMAIDSDAIVKSLMSFLTLRPGDTDAEFFEDYTQEQLEFADAHGESLAAEVFYRFGE